MATPPAPAASHERIREHLQTLGVLIPEEQFDDVLRQAEQNGWSHLELLDRLFGNPALQKRERIIGRRIRDAHFAENKTLESFDWKFNAAAIDRAEMEELATGDFIRRGDNLLMVGLSGIGKPQPSQCPASNRGMRGLRNDHRSNSPVIRQKTKASRHRTAPWPRAALPH